MKPVDESKLNAIDRLGLAYCRLGGWQWDDLLGPKPLGFDSLPNYDRRKFRSLRKPVPTRYDFIRPKILAIEEIIGRANTSRCWWIFKLGRTEDEWRVWYLSGEHERLDECRNGHSKCYP